MKDERAHLQLFDLIARDWTLPAAIDGVTFNATDTAVAFSGADGSIHLCATADKDAPNARVRRAVDTGRLTIAPRTKPVMPLKVADYAQGRSSAVVPHGASNFAFAKDNGRINTLTPGGIAVHLPTKAPGSISGLALSPDGTVLAYACTGQLFVTPSTADAPVRLTVPAPITAIAFSPDGQTLAVGHAGGFTLWQTGALEQEPGHIAIAGAPTGIIWQPDGAFLAACLGSDGFCLIDMHSSAAITYGSFPTPVHSIGFSPATQSVVAAGAFRVAAWGLQDQAPMTSAKAGLVVISAVATCPTRNLVAVGYANGLLSLAEIGRPSEILLRENTGAGIVAMAWSKNGTYLALGGADGSAALVEFPESMFKS